MAEGLGDGPAPCHLAWTLRWSLLLLNPRWSLLPALGGEAPLSPPAVQARLTALLLVIPCFFNPSFFSHRERGRACAHGGAHSHEKDQSCPGPQCGGTLGQEQAGGDGLGQGQPGTDFSVSGALLEAQAFWTLMW